jgi:hypothetical protein
MAAQPPANEHSPQKPQKPWYQTPLVVALLGALATAILVFAATQLAKDKPSGKASFVLKYSAPAGHRLEIEGSGWDGDSTVSIRHPLAGSSYRNVKVKVQDGQFSYALPVFLEDGEKYTVTVTGMKSGHEESVDFTGGEGGIY